MWVLGASAHGNCSGFLFGVEFCFVLQSNSFYSDDFKMSVAKKYYSIQERLEREYNLSLITTAPSVVYRVNCVNGETVISFAYTNVNFGVDDQKTPGANVILLELN